jgi:hypothetical protein
LIIERSFAWYYEGNCPPDRNPLRISDFFEPFIGWGVLILSMARDISCAEREL